MIPVIFDLDGTLVDSVPDLRAALNTVFTAEGHPPFDLARVTSFVGNGLSVLVSRAMADLGIPESQHPRLRAAVLAAYEAAPSALTRIYPGVIDALETLRAAGHPLAICTNKPEPAARLVLDGLDLGHFFDVVVGGGRTAELKPDPAPLFLCMKELGTDAAIFVGDSEIDAEAGERAGLPFLLYTEGYRHSPAEDLPQTARFNSYSELPWLVAEHA